jgi:hypothetical protein
LTANAWSPGDVFYTNFTTSFSPYVRHYDLGLQANDELDALDIKPVPGPLPFFGVSLALATTRKLRRLSSPRRASTID